MSQSQTTHPADSTAALQCIPAPPAAPGRPRLIRTRDAEALLTGLVDVVPTLRLLTVHDDPLLTNATALDQPAMLATGDEVRWYEVDRSTNDALAADIALELPRDTFLKAPGA